MTSQNENRAEVFEKVELYLGELFEDIYHDDETDHFYVRYGSTVLEVSVDPYGPDEVVVMFTSYCVRGVRADQELLRHLLELNHTLPFGSFSLVGDEVYFQHALFGRTLERPNLLNAVASVSTIADEYDDLIAEKFGGERALDRIRHTGGRKRRGERTGWGEPN